MTNYENGAISAQSQQVQFQATKNPYDPRFNGQEKLVKDSEGFLYKIEEIDLWFEKTGITKEFTETLRNSNKKLTLQEFWDTED